MTNISPQIKHFDKSYNDLGMKNLFISLWEIY